MSILINKDTKVITQGITGKTGQFHTRACRGAAPLALSARSKRTAGRSSGGAAAARIREAVEADLDLAICITEGIPVRDMIEVKDRMRREGRKTLLLGPNCPGTITPDELKIGIMPGHIHRKPHRRRVAFGHADV